MSYMDVEALKVGDRVGVSSLYEHDLYLFGTVERVTKTQVTVRCGESLTFRFTRERGRQVGAHSSWRSRHLCTVAEAEEVNRERHERLRHNQLVAKVRDVNWKHVPAEKIEQVLYLINDTQGATP